MKYKKTINLLLVASMVLLPQVAYGEPNPKKSNNFQTPDHDKFCENNLKNLNKKDAKKIIKFEDDKEYQELFKKSNEEKLINKLNPQDVCLKTISKDHIQNHINLMRERLKKIMQTLNKISEFNALVGTLPNINEVGQKTKEQTDILSNKINAFSKQLRNIENNNDEEQVIEAIEKQKQSIAKIEKSVDQWEININKQIEMLNLINSRKTMQKTSHSIFDLDKKAILSVFETKTTRKSMTTENDKSKETQKELVQKNLEYKHKRKKEIEDLRLSAPKIFFNETFSYLKKRDNYSRSKTSGYKFVKDENDSIKPKCIFKRPVSQSLYKNSLAKQK